MGEKRPQIPPDFEEILRPEHDLERAFLRDPEFLEGLTWGEPRYGHPEGEVYKHIAEVLANIDRLNVSPEDRCRLRIIAFVHDTFKYKEVKSFPRDWSRHHSIHARKYLELHTSNEALLNVTELHDEAYYCWCDLYLYQAPRRGEERLERLLRRLGADLQLYYLFFKCDTQTGDKNQAPLKWFEHSVPGLALVELSRKPPPSVR